MRPLSTGGPVDRSGGRASARSRTDRSTGGRFSRQNTNLDSLVHHTSLWARENGDVEGLCICIAHSHPRGGLFFSEFDDVADKESFEIVFGRMETERPHFAMVMDHKGEFLVRAYGPDLKPQSVELTRVVGDRIEIRYPGRGKG